MRAPAVFAVLAILGCGGSKGGSGSTTGATADVPDAAAATTAIAPALDAGTDEAAALTEAECERMADHMIDVQLAERKRAGKELPEPGQIDEIRRGIKVDFVPQCVDEQYGRAVYECWLRASSADAFESCAGGPPPPAD